MKPFVVIGLLVVTSAARADVGVLMPWSVKHEPDPSILSIRSMDVRVRIDHLHARVDMKTIFENHTDEQLEGRYVLPLQGHAAVEDFSVWEGEERLMGVVVEKKKGRAIYEKIVAQKLDPGLGESDDEGDRAPRFAMRVAPIPPRGTARVEITFSEELPVTSRGVLFTLPWKPRRYGKQVVKEMHLDVAVEGPYPLGEVTVKPRGALRWSAAPSPGGTRFAGTFDGTNVPLTEDFTIEMSLGEMALGTGGSQVDALAYRDPAPGGRKDISPFGDGTIYRDDRGYFMVRTIASPPGAAATATGTPGADGRRVRDVVILLDTSLSMQWEKLDRSFAALEYCLSRLGAEDRFTVATFDEEVRLAAPALQPATAQARAAALKFVRDSYLGGGTDLGGALGAGLSILSQAPRAEAERFVVLISDGNPTLGEIGYRKIGEIFAQANQGKGGTGSPIARLFVLGVGDDAQAALLGRLASAGDGYFGQVREGSDMAFLLRTFFDKLGQSSLRDVVVLISGLAGITQVYPSARPSVFAGSDATFFGRYATPGRAEVTVRGRVPDGVVEDKAQVGLPERDATRPWVARGWARMRIDDLLERIAAEGEKEDWVREVIALAKEFRFVTPYTSFIAAPRSLLRPRVIQPGDPVLRVKAAADIRAVTAMFPFGLTQALQYLPSEGVWETRFLAPTWMRDGTYFCTLVLTDNEGHRTAEKKSFVIDSRPPEISVALGGKTARAGETVEIVVRADADTRRISARVGDGLGAEVKWDPERKASVGTLVIPPDTPTGRAEVTVVAEDMAHNLSSARVPLDVIGGR